MENFWEQAFKNNQEMWGSAPTNSALAAAEIFSKNGSKKILIPGIGYGRNAQAFINKGMDVTGIEISQTAIDLATERYGNALKIHYGSVTNMPFDDQLYDGIYCHALIHLLDKDERIQLTAHCFQQLAPHGTLIFTAITKEAQTYGQGERISKDRYGQFGGVKIYFYDGNSILEEFEEFGLSHVDKIEENYPFYFIQCRK